MKDIKRSHGGRREKRITEGLSESSKFKAKIGQCKGGVVDFPKKSRMEL